MNVIRAQLGLMVSVRFTVRKVRADNATGQRQRVNGCVAAVLKPDGTAAAVPPITYERKGVYVVHVDTSALAVGDHLVQASFGIGFDATTSASVQRLRRNVILRLVVAL